MWPTGLNRSYVAKSFIVFFTFDKIETGLLNCIFFTTVEEQWGNNSANVTCDASWQTLSQRTWPSFLAPSLDQWAPLLLIFMYLFFKDWCKASYNQGIVNLVLLKLITCLYITKHTYCISHYLHNQIPCFPSWRDIWWQNNLCVLFAVRIPWGKIYN